MKLLDGKKVSEYHFLDLKLKFEQFGRSPCLAVVQMKNDEIGNAYLKQIILLAEKLGFNVQSTLLDDEVTTEELVSLIFSFNMDSEVHGILIQEPLPLTIDRQRVRQVLLPSKDVDGFSSFHCAKLYEGNETIIPCTCQAIMILLEFYQINLVSKHVVIINRSQLIGKPLTYCFIARDATVTVCHSMTNDLMDITKTADVLITAVGKRDFITKDMVKKDAIIVDVGTEVIDGKVYGDVAFNEVADICSFITPVPGGVGPMTSVMLAKNFYQLLDQN